MLRLFFVLQSNSCILIECLAVQLKKDYNREVNSVEKGEEE